ncbi:hypothetical protein NDU88_003128 [Pleurodeles waltl]|uniref:Uncharacterized protein n=1 Tax=Pleurodeles waltl TaxID=8319 RepID=A0AAV7QE08_PLEWA|nr:hypothetical protein NDU88_003128 [Pleurodeles waltl]
MQTDICHLEKIENVSAETASFPVVSGGIDGANEVVYNVDPEGIFIDRRGKRMVDSVSPNPRVDASLTENTIVAVIAFVDKEVVVILLVVSVNVTLVTGVGATCIIDTRQRSGHPQADPSQQADLSRRMSRD